MKRYTINATCGFLTCPGVVEDADGEWVRSEEASQARADADWWRLAYNSWQDWAKELLSDLGRQTLHGEHGDGPAREIIGQLAGMTPGAPRCSRCGCFASRHEVDDEELRGCADCECTAYEAPR